MTKWYQNSGADRDIAVSSRIRLARNLKDFPFPNKMTPEQKFAVIQKVSDAILKSNSEWAHKFKFYDMDKISRISALSMVERHLISPDFAENGQGRALLISDDETVSIMINEEDHIRIQVLSAGLELKSAYDIAAEIDSLLDCSLEFAFDKELGYLTECPSNLGTGMRACVMLHIPALSSMGAVAPLTNTISKIGLTLRGTFGEGSKVRCSMYQLSNQVTLGISESSAIENLQTMTKQIIARERQARSEFDRDKMEDIVYRAWGLLSNARIMSSAEFLDLADKLRLGIGMELFDCTDIIAIDELIMLCQPATLQEKAGGVLDDETRDKLRARTIREKLRKD